MKKLIKLCGLLLALTLVLTACSTANQNNKGAGSAKDGNEAEIEKSAMKLVKAVEEGKYKLVSTEELKGWVDKKEDMIIIDTMPAKSFEKNRIPSAINAEIPVKLSDVTEEQKDNFLKALGTDKSKKIVLYCGFVKCERSHVAALIAKEAGFENVYRQPGGIVAWMDSKYDIEGTK